MPTKEWIPKPGGSAKQRQKVFLETLKDGWTVEDSARRAGVQRAAVDKWKQVDPIFRQLYESAGQANLRRPRDTTRGPIDDWDEYVIRYQAMRRDLRAFMESQLEEEAVLLDMKPLLEPWLAEQETAFVVVEELIEFIRDMIWRNAWTEENFLEVWDWWSERDEEERALIKKRLTRPPGIPTPADGADLLTKIDELDKSASEA